MTVPSTDTAAGYLRTGLFLPVANHGWVMSMSAPTDPATFALNVAGSVGADIDITHPWLATGRNSPVRR